MNSLVVQWLGLSFHCQLGLIPGQGRPCKPCGVAKKKKVFTHIILNSLSLLLLINWLLFEDCSYVHSYHLSFGRNILIPSKGHHRTRFYVSPLTSQYWKHSLTNPDGQTEEWSGTTIPLFQAFTNAICQPPQSLP